MLSKNARRIFEIAKSSEGEKISYIGLEKQLGWDFDKVQSAANQLIEAGLADNKYYSPLPGRGEILWGIVLTEEGRNSRAYFWAKVGAFLFKSIAVPIFVAFATALITAYITARIVVGS